MFKRIFRAATTRIKNLPDSIVQKPRIWKYNLLSSAKCVQGKARIHQPVLFLGAGKIVIGKNVNLGYRRSPYFYSGYIYIEARNPSSIIKIGDHCWINNNCAMVSEGGGIEVGENSLLGASVEIIDSDFHALDLMKRSVGELLKIAHVFV